VRHDREKFRLRLARRFGLRARRLLLLELTRLLLRAFAIGDVAQRDEERRLTLPLDVRHAKLRVQHLTAGAHDLDRARVLADNRKSEVLAHEVIRGEWGNDPQRSQKLTAAGYDARAVQAEVNRELR